MKKLLSLILAMMMLFAAMLPCVAETTEAVTETAAEEEIEFTVLGEGETTFFLTVTDAEDNTTCFQINTNETTVGAALLALGLVDGPVTEYGLYVKTVNGILADYDVDGSYWAFFINGEYAMTGVDSTPVEADAVYSLAVAK